MGRKNRRDLVLRIRFKDSEGVPKTSLVLNSSPKNARRNFGAGRVLKIGKMKPEQIHKVGEFNPLPESLMKEFAQERRLQRSPVQTPIVEN